VHRLSVFLIGISLVALLFRTARREKAMRSMRRVRVPRGWEHLNMKKLDMMISTAESPERTGLVGAKQPISFSVRFYRCDDSGRSEKVLGQNCAGRRSSPRASARLRRIDCLSEASPPTSLLVQWCIGTRPRASFCKHSEAI
jgi:hypothetical protein